MQLNQQPPEKASLSETLDVHSIFYTIQGEGPFSGRTAIFIRLAGCNLQCPLCDTDYTSKRQTYSPHALFIRVQELCEELNLKHYPMVVITGGEPLRQNLFLIVALLQGANFLVQVETNGSYPILEEYWRGYMPVFVCSPKAMVKRSVWEHCYDVKYVLNADSMDPDDGLPVRALDHTVLHRVSRPPVGWTGTVWLQPVDTQDEAENKRHLDAVRESCLKHGYRLCLQTHKIIGVE